MTNIKFRYYEKGDEIQLTELFNIAFQNGGGFVRTPKNWYWRYVQSPNFDPKMMGNPSPWTYTEIRLATSTDGFNWVVNPAVIGYGGTSCIVETPDGRLLIYYVNQ